MPKAVTHRSMILRRRAGLFPALALAAALIGLGPLTATARGTPDNFADLTEQLLPTVVNISTSQTLKRAPSDAQGIPDEPSGSPLDDFFKNFRDRQAPRRQTALGSGFVIDPSGLVVTNNHVIKDADEISVILNDGTTMPATVLGHDEKTDLALLKVNPRKPLPTAKFGNSDKARVGEWVIAIGEPFGLQSTVTAGIVSARNRNIESGDYDDFIQTDAQINPGNSGGPLFNMDGEVIGINSEIYSPSGSGGSVGIGFSIPSNEAKVVIAQLRNGGIVRRGMIGVRIQEISPEIAESMNLDASKGELIAGVTPNGPAAKAGIQSGDVVLTFDGKPVTSRTLPRMVAEATIGKAVNVEVLRKGQHKILPVTIQRLVDDDTKLASAAKPGPKAAAQSKTLSANLGLTLATLTPDARTHYRIGRDVHGVLVTDVDEDSPAGQKNIRAGDVIAEVAQQPVTTADQVSARIDAEKRAGHKVVLLEVSRDGELTFIGIRLP